MSISANDKQIRRLKDRMRILFCTNLPSPYRVDFFNELGKFCDLTVCYERKTASDRDAKWKATRAIQFIEVYLDLKPIGTDRSKGDALWKYIIKHPFDRLIFTNYVSPATMKAITYCRLKHIPYWIEYDGGFNNKDLLPKYIIKKYLLGGAVGHLTTCDEHIVYLKSLGIKAERIFKYPFSSISENDIRQTIYISDKEKEKAKTELSIEEEKVLLTVGRFSYEGGYGKGYDTLMHAAKDLPSSIGIYIVGDEPTQEFIRWKEKENLLNVHFVGFKQKQELAKYYAAADAFIMLSRKDIWGLVINEAMAFGLPIITTKQCLAGTELVKGNVNGYLVESGNVSETVEKIKQMFASDEKLQQMGKESKKIIEHYTIEEMAKRHIQILA